MDPTIKDFESALAELDTIVRKMEEGELTLEKSMELYERGLQLSRFCHSTLEAAERCGPQGVRRTQVPARRRPFPFRASSIGDRRRW